MQEELLYFSLDSEPVSCERYGNGHINDTYKAVCGSGRAYILQRINKAVFVNPEKVMENIVRITQYLSLQGVGPREALRLVAAKDGRLWYTDAQGDVWRVYEFIEGALSLDAAASPADFYQSALGFGQFQKQLADFPATTLHETIRDFHNTPWRYENLRHAAEQDVCGRARLVADELAFAFAREKEASMLMELLHTGELPLRVAHNDTKLNNILLDEKTRRALCVVDLDTVMPGLSLFDFGDSIRFGASTAAEDEQDLSRVRMDINLFQVYTEGYLSICGDSLTPREIELLPMGALVMTLENGVRFLTDYLQGDTYYRIHRPGQNLDRCRTQFRLVESMEAQWADMQAIVERIRNALRK